MVTGRFEPPDRTIGAGDTADDVQISTCQNDRAAGRPCRRLCRRRRARSGMPRRARAVPVHRAEPGAPTGPLSTRDRWDVQFGF